MVAPKLAYITSNVSEQKYLQVEAVSYLAAQMHTEFARADEQIRLWTHALREHHDFFFPDTCNV